jgi:succinoglycan biosynthesis protein ExoA
MPALPSGDGTGWSPTIDVVIPAYQEERYLDRCLEAVLDQDYPAELTTVWVVDAGSTDRTAVVAADWARRDRRVEVLSSQRRLTTPEALNLGIEAGQAELVARVDAHGWPEPGFLKASVRALDEGGPTVACVGGTPRPVAETPFGRALTMAWTSRFGVGGSVYAMSGHRRQVTSVPWGMYRRSTFAEVGLFDPNMNYGEDEELNWRLHLAGGKIMLDDRIEFGYVARSSWSRAFAQYHRWGAARVRVVRAHPDFLRLHHLAPAALVTAAAGLLAASPVSHAARRAQLALAGVYGCACGVAAVQASGGRNAAMTLRVALAFGALHLGYGTGMFGELVRQVRSNRRLRPRAGRAV